MQKKMSCREQQWKENYDALKSYVAEHRQLPNKKKLENRSLLNWWKYNKKCMKLNKLTDEQLKLLQQLSDMRNVKVVNFLP